MSRLEQYPWASGGDENGGINSTSSSTPPSVITLDINRRASYFRVSWILCAI